MPEAWRELRREWGEQSKLSLETAQAITSLDASKISDPQVAPLVPTLRAIAFGMLADSQADAARAEELWNTADKACADAGGRSCTREMLKWFNDRALMRGFLKGLVKND